MKKIICFFILFAAHITMIHGQNIDSLINLLDTKIIVEEQFSIYEKVCRFYYKSYNADKLNFYANKGLMLAKQEKNKEKSWLFTEFIGYAYLDKANYDTALIYFEKALDIAKNEKNKQHELYIYMDIGALYGNQSKRAYALEYFIKALAVSESIGDKNKQMANLGNIGTLYRSLNNNDRAIYYLEQMQIIAEELNEPHGKRKAYYELGFIYKNKGDFEKAIENIQNALEIIRSIGDTAFEVASLQTLAEIYYRQEPKDYEKAMEYSMESLRICEKIGNKHLASAAWTSLSNVYRELKQYKECRSTSLKAWDCDSTIKDAGINIFSNLIISDIHLGNYDKILTYFQKYCELKDQVSAKSFQETLTEMDVKYETEKKEMRIATLEKEKQFYIWLGISGFIVLLLIIGLLLINRRLAIQKRKVAEQQREIAEQQRRLAEQKVIQLEQEKQLVATQAVLDGEAAERSRLARDLHDGLGGLLSVVKLNLKDLRNHSIMDNPDAGRFDKAMELLDESIGELRRVAHHMMPESLVRYGLKTSLEDFCRAIPGAHFQYYGGDQRLDSRLEVLIYRCAYELVNNAVKHAHATNINLQLMVDNGLVSLSVRDDGCGFDPASVASGAGLENIRTRVSVYNGKMNIYSSPGNGTEVSIEIERNEG